MEDARITIQLDESVLKSKDNYSISDFNLDKSHACSFKHIHKIMHAEYFLVADESGSNIS